MIEMGTPAICHIQKATFKMNKVTTQQEFLRETAQALGLSQKEMAQRMGAPWTTFEKWLLPSTSNNSRDMPQIAWQLAREIVAHESLKKKIRAK